MRKRRHGILLFFLKGKPSQKKKNSWIRSENLYGNLQVWGHTSKNQETYSIFIKIGLLPEISASESMTWHSALENRSTPLCTVIKKKKKLIIIIKNNKKHIKIKINKIFAEMGAWRGRVIKKLFR